MKHKYGAKKVIVTEDGTLFEVEQLKKYNITDVTGQHFDSKAEAQYYLQLRSNPDVRAIEFQPVFILQEKPKIKYIADFRVTYQNGQVQIVDVKGVQTTAFRLKVRMFKAKYPHEKLVIVTKKGRNFVRVSA